MLLVSYDSKYLFSTNGVCLNVFSVSSGELVYRLSYSSPNSNQSDDNESLIIKSICINPTNKYQLLSFHLSGRVCLWDYEDGLLLKSFETKLIIKKVIRTETSLYALGKLKNDTNQNRLASTKSASQLNYSLYKFLIDETLKNATHIEHQLILSDINLNTDKMAIAIDSDGKYVAYIEGTKHIVINQFKKNNTNQLKRIKAKKELTCLAIHPNEDCIAAGTKQGQILLWYNYLECESVIENDTMQLIGDKEQLNLIKPVKNTLHWHSLPVLSLHFTTEGSFLLSGGHECVLVKWMYKTGQKDFLPRLGAPINEINCSKDNTLYALHHSDNIIHIIGTNFSVLQTFSGFVCPNFTVKKTTDSFYPSGLNYFTRLNCFVSNGRPGHLQFYSHSSDKLLFNLDIADENYISPENLNKPLCHSEVECVAFNHDSAWLVTVERRNDEWTTPETRLKFWHFCQINNKFTLNTLVKQPHSFDRITKIKFKPNENTLFTCGDDGCFKSWVLRENRQQANSDQPTSNWIYSTCNGFRDMIPTDIDFVSLEQDVDLVAVSFNHTCTIWSHGEDGLTFINDLIHCDSNDLIRQVKFLNSDHLVVMHEKYLNLWSINDNSKSSMRCEWSTQLNDLIYMCENPLDSTQVILFTKLNKTQTVDNEEDSSSTIQIGLFDSDSKQLNTIYSFNVYSNNKLHFICLKRQESDEDDEDKSQARQLFNKLNIFYCDNRGVLDRIAYKSSVSTIDVDLNESMWNNRKTLNKNLPKSNLTQIIDLHKSNNLNDQFNDHLIENENNSKFEANFKKIEITPAYLLPKVSTFCYDFLKSMLHNYDDANETEENVTNKLKKKLQDLNGVETSSDDEDDEMNGLPPVEIKKSNGVVVAKKLADDFNKYPRLTNNVLI